MDLSSFDSSAKKTKKKIVKKKTCRHKSDFSDSAKNIIVQFQDLNDVSKPNM